MFSCNKFGWITQVAINRQFQPFISLIISAFLLLVQTVLHVPNDLIVWFEKSKTCEIQIKFSHESQFQKWNVSNNFTWRSIDGWCCEFNSQWRQLYFCWFWNPSLSILYKNVRNVRFMLFRKNSNLRQTKPKEKIKCQWHHRTPIPNKSRKWWPQKTVMQISFMSFLRKSPSPPQLKPILSLQMDVLDPTNHLSFFDFELEHSFNSTN